jgi:DNA-binding response OmpR family regulator
MDRPIDVDVGVGLGAIDFDFDEVETQPPDLSASDEPPGRRALIVNADRDERLYIRAKLALAQLCEADEAETAAQALELARGGDYVVAVVDFNVPDADGWALFKGLGDGQRPISKVILTKSRPSLAERIHARIAGATGFFAKPPHPGKLHELLLKI